MKEMILFDGGFGTYYEQSLPIYFKNMQPEFAVLRDPEGVAKVHRAYLESGAAAIKTDTFGVNLNLCESKEQALKLIHAGYAIAKQEASAFSAEVYADIGPIREASDREEQYCFLASSFIECGAERFLFETMSELEVLLPAITLIRKKCPQATVIVSFAVTVDGYTANGEYYIPLLERTQQYADHVGLNCQCGPAHMTELMEKIDHSKLSCIAMPNAGYPSLENGRTVFRNDPEYFALKMEKLISLGIKGVGGCCGTTPAHIKALAARMPKTEVVRESKPLTAPKAKAKPDPIVGRFQKPIAVELPAPNNTDCSYLIDAAKKVKAYGADFITIPDSPLGNAKADSVMMAAKIRREAGIAVIPHMTCRDKNQLAVKGQLLAASMEEIRDILVITGDAIQPSLRQNVKQVYGFNSFSLISYLAGLNDEVFYEQPFHICAALNTSAANFEAECKRAEKKIQNGAQYLFTQPIFSEEGVERFAYAKEHLNAKLFAGIMPVAGYKNALFLHNEVSGIDIPESLLHALQDKSPEEQRAVSVAYACRLADALYPMADGFYIMTPLKKTELSLALVEHIREKQIKDEEEHK